MLLCEHAFVLACLYKLLATCFVLAVTQNAAVANCLLPLVEESHVAFKLYFCFA